MRKRKETLVMAGVALLILAAAAVWLVRVFHLRAPHDPGQNDPPATLVTMVEIESAPADVRQAAELLKTSRVGYAMVKPDKTYLIIATGEQGPKVKIDRAEAQRDGGSPDFVDLFLKTAEDGRRLMIATTPLKGNVEYQFNLDGVFAAIPALHNPHNLPLVYLDEARSFSVIAPTRDQMVEGQMLHVAGYARVFEAAFRVTVITDKGRQLGWAPVQAAVGAPNWGSFVADVTIDTKDLPAMGFVVFTADGGAEIAVPVRFHRPPQLG